MLALRAQLALRERGLERCDEYGTRAARLDHVVDVPALCRRVGVREPLLVVVDELRSAGCRVVGVLELVAEDDVDGSPAP